MIKSQTTLSTQYNSTNSSLKSHAQKKIGVSLLPFKSNNLSQQTIPVHKPVTSSSPLSISKKYFNQIVPQKYINNLINQHINNKKVVLDNKSIYILNNDFRKEVKSINYADLKPLINVNKFFGIEQYDIKLGDNGCRCPGRCEWKLKWTKGYSENMQAIFKSLLKDKKNTDQTSEIQIEKDLRRTHSYCKTFKDERFVNMLKKVLQAYSIYDTELRYIQGFNNIAGIFLYHIQQAGPTFWALVQILQEKQFRQIYLDNFQKLNQHCNTVKSLFQLCFPDVWLHLNNFGIDLNSILYGWFLSLMSTCIPLQFMHWVVDGFKKEGWNYMYRVMITYFAFMKNDILKARDQVECLMVLGAESNSQGTRGKQSIKQNKMNKEWPQILLSTENISIQNSLTLKKHSSIKPHH